MKLNKKELEMIVEALDGQNYPPSILVDALDILRAIKSFTFDGEILPEQDFELPIPKGFEDELIKLLPKEMASRFNSR